MERKGINQKRRMGEGLENCDEETHRGESGDRKKGHVGHEFRNGEGKERGGMRERWGLEKIV